MTARKWFAAVRFGAAALCVVALVHRQLWGLSSQTIAGQNFFAYLTIQSNIAFAFIAVIGGAIAMRRDEDPRWFTDARTVVLSWTITAGLVFALLVWQSGVRGVPMTVPWSDHVLHFLLPAIAIVAWNIGPGRRAARWRLVAFVLLYPVLWGVFTLWRGSHIGWYPYYFLDLRQVSGIPEFLGTCVIALSVFAAVACGLIALSRWRETVPDSHTRSRDMRWRWPARYRRITTHPKEML